MADTYRPFLEKLGGTNAATFVGNKGELFYDPNAGNLKVSDGSTAGGISAGVGAARFKGTGGFTNFGLGTAEHTWTGAGITVTYGAVANYGSFQFKPLDLDNAIPYASGSSFGSDEDVLLFIEDPGQYLIGDETITVLNENTYILPNSNYASSQNILGAPSSPTFSFGGSNRGHTYRYSLSYGGKFDITSQVNSRHEIKAGIQYSFSGINLSRSGEIARNCIRITSLKRTIVNARASSKAGL